MMKCVFKSGCGFWNEINLNFVAVIPGMFLKVFEASDFLIFKIEKEISACHMIIVKTKCKKMNIFKGF